MISRLIRGLFADMDSISLYIYIYMLIGAARKYVSSSLLLFRIREDRVFVFLSLTRGQSVESLQRLVSVQRGSTSIYALLS